MPYLLRQKHSCNGSLLQMNCALRQTWVRGEGGGTREERGLCLWGNAAQASSQRLKSSCISKAYSGPAGFPSSRFLFPPSLTIVAADGYLIFGRPLKTNKNLLQRLFLPWKIRKIEFAPGVCVNNRSNNVFPDGGPEEVFLKWSVYWPASPI